MKAIIVSAIAALFSCQSATAQSTAVQAKATFICDTVLNEKPFDYKSYFTPAFINQIPEQYFHSQISELVNAVGACQANAEIDANGNSATYKFVGPSARYVALAFALDANGLIDRLHVQDIVFPDVVISSWSAAESYAKSLSGHASLTIRNFSTGAANDKDGASPQALGSEFKLYVLGAIADQVNRGTWKWDQTFPIRPEWKALPSGVMQTWQFI